MQRILVACFINCLFFVSCNNDENKVDPLTQPPYGKITDSIKAAPNDADLYYRRGSLLYSNNQPVFAERDLRKAWELTPKEQYAIKLTDILKHRNIDTALAFLEHALDKLPGNIFVQLSLANGYYSKNQSEKSLSICDQIIVKYPNAIDAYDLKSQILKKQNKMAEAIATLEQAYRYAPGDVDLVHTLAFDYAESKNSKVLALSDSLIKADTEKSHADPYYFKGVYYSNTGNFSEAIRQFDQAIVKNFNYLPAYINKGVIYYDQKKYDEAYKTFNLAHTISPDEGEPYLWMARTQEAIGNKADAKINYQKAYSLDKTLTEAKEAADRL